MCAAAAALIDTADRDGPAASSHFSLHPPRAKAGLNPLNRLEFGKRIEAFCRLHASQEKPENNGALFSFRIDAARARFGMRWNNVREKAFAIIEVGLDRGLQRGEVYLVRSAHEVLVFVTGAPIGELEERVEQIAREITARLCGEVPGGNAIGVRRLKFDLLGGLDGIAGMQNLVDRIDTAQRLEEKQERRTFASISKRLVNRFRPTVDLRAQEVSLYFMFQLLRADDELVPIDTVRPYSVNGMFDAAHDCWAVDQCAFYLKKMKKHKISSTLVMQMHYETLAAMRFRSPFLVRCRELPENATEQLMIEILGVPPSLPYGRMRELFAYLKNFVSGVIVRGDPTLMSAENLKGAGVAALSIDLDDMGDDDDAAVEMLGKFGKMAEANGFKAICHNAWAVSMCHQAVALGAHFINGDALMPALERPDIVHKL